MTRPCELPTAWPLGRWGRWASALGPVLPHRRQSLCRLATSLAHVTEQSTLTHRQDAVVHRLARATAVHAESVRVEEAGCAAQQLRRASLAAGSTTSRERNSKDCHVQLDTDDLRPDRAIDISRREMTVENVGTSVQSGSGTFVNVLPAACVPPVRCRL